MTLTDFLLARIAADEEHLAQESGYLEWCQECGFGQQPQSPYSLSRLTIECDAKRRIVERCASLRASAPDGSPERWELSQWAELATVDEVVAVLALPYASHPDYDESWRP